MINLQKVWFHESSVRRVEISDDEKTIDVYLANHDKIKFTYEDVNNFIRAKSYLLNNLKTVKTENGENNEKHN